MSQRTGAPPDQTTPARLDWSRAIVGDPAPCVVCGRPALLRHPETGRPHHKVCSEPATPAATVEETEILSCRFCGEPASMPGPEGKPEHWSCRRKAADR
ncbi:hypothetical protein [Streptomyces sp. A012304]|uniref:hypothetical protein n=1 Tax=Streptomyces sp. A012304 TaxID=375446 RepID=UPI00223280AC|nr:hypothetical protein [Streptomyces sp. A012304]GKQ37192.1 hypothetical protein ALMP_37310 [Streptomyces sp. A012304]